MTRHSRRTGALALVATGLAFTSVTAITSGARPAAATPGAGVFLLGDSVTESLSIGSPSTFTATITPTYPDAVIDGRSNRRTVTASTYQGSPVTSGLDEIKANAGRIGDVIIIELGYNDCVAPGFPAAIDQILTELTSQDVPTVLWSMMTTLIRPEYASCNAALNDATKRWPTLRLADWDGYSHAHPEWFDDDGLGVHLTATGRTAYATFLRDQLDDLPGIGVRPPAAQHCLSSVAIGRTVQSLAAGTPLAPTSGLFSARTPLRVLDTRAGRPLGAGRVIEVQIGGRSGVPASASAAVLNVTADQPCGVGYITVYPCGGAPPDASNLNLTAGTTRPNQVLVQLGASGRVCLTSSAQTDVIADLSGWFSSASLGRFQARPPGRVLDTRLGTGAPLGRLTANVALTLTLPDAPVGARAAVLNVTATQPIATGFVTVWPAPLDGSPCVATGAPDASNVNFVAGQTVANLVTVGAASNGRVCVKTTAAAHLIADVSGWYADTGATLVAARPQRMLDTRLGTGAAKGALANNEAIAIRLTDLPANATAVVLNLTAAEPVGAGFVKVWPANTGGACTAAEAPDVSNLNVSAGHTAPNLVTVALGGQSTVCASTTVRLHLIADVFGWFV
jgi:hypothetical protein